LTKKAFFIIVRVSYSATLAGRYLMNSIYSVFPEMPAHPAKNYRLKALYPNMTVFMVSDVPSIFRIQQGMVGQIIIGPARHRLGVTTERKMTLK
jgi:hypothetical protein